MRRSTILSLPLHLVFPEWLICYINQQTQHNSIVCCYADCCIFYHYAKCHYAECRYAECRSTSVGHSDNVTNLNVAQAKLLNKLECLSKRDILPYWARPRAYPKGGASCRSQFKLSIFSLTNNRLGWMNQYKNKTKNNRLGRKCQF